MIGSSGVGKSSILLRYTDDEFDPKQRATIGVDYKVKLFSKHGCKVQLAVWDTAGQEDYDRLRPLSYPQTVNNSINFENLIFPSKFLSYFLSYLLSYSSLMFPLVFLSHTHRW